MVRTMAEATTLGDAYFGRAGAPRRINIAMLALMAPLPLAAIDINTTRTVLITPISPAVRDMGIAIGVLSGLAIGACFMVLTRMSPRRPGWGRSIGTFAFFSLIFAPLNGAIGGHFAWRLADLYAFDWRAPVGTPKPYDVDSFEKAGRGTAKYASIDPFNAGETQVEITDADYQTLLKKTPRGHYPPFCLWVLQEQSGSAIRILTGSALRAHPSALASCP
jgi:hypothetical protein